MAAIDDLRSADSLQFANISYTLSVPTRSDSMGNTGAFCVQMTGPLAFSIATTTFGLTLDNGVVVNVPFTGAVSGETITWSCDTRPSGAAYMGYGVQRIYGSFTTRVDAVTSMASTDCSGNPRIARATLTTVAGQNAINVDVAFLASTVTATVSNLSTTNVLVEDRAQPVPFGVRLGVNKDNDDGCGHHYQLAGDTVVWTASVINLAERDPETARTYRWTVSGEATIVGPHDQASVTVRWAFPRRFPPRPTGHASVQCDVTITTTLELGTATGVANVAVLTAAEAEQLAAICKLRQATLPLPSVLVSGVGAGFTAGGVRFVDPLWDPTPDELRGALTLSRTYNAFELQQVHAAAQRIQHTAAALSKATAAVIGEREQHARESERE